MTDEKIVVFSRVPSEEEVAQHLMEQRCGAFCDDPTLDGDAIPEEQNGETCACRESARAVLQLLTGKEPSPSVPVADAPGRARAQIVCFDCGRPYGNEHGFPDLVVSHDVWKQISPTRDEGGMLCPSCICRRLHDAGIECAGRFTSGPLAGSLTPPEAHQGDCHGIYIASRASIPERSAEWRRWRDIGAPIISSWIDEAGEGETADFGELWDRITREIAGCKRLVLYAEQDDFPLKGALIEAGIAIGMGKPVVVCLPGVNLDGRSLKPIGSWLAHPLVTRNDNLAEALSLPVPPPDRG